MFLTFVSPPKDQDADARFPHGVCGESESTCRSLQFSICSLAFVREGVVRFRKPEAHPNPPQRYNTLQTMAMEVREGQAAAARQMVQGAAAPSLIAVVLCMCAPLGQNCDLTSRRNLEKYLFQISA